MKIGILTQPLQKNYGGIIQNYALQTILKRMGHEVYTIDAVSKAIPLYIKCGSILKRILLKIRNKNILIRVWTTTKENRFLSQYIREFINTHIKRTYTIRVPKDIRKLQDEYTFDAYIVGSDQVWRPIYSPHLPTYFLDFLYEKNEVRKVAYAASFGTDKWELSPKETQKARTLIRQFNAISVREDSAVSLCEKYLEIASIHLLDPSMLLTKDDYIELVNNHGTEKSKGDLFIYILDRSNEKDEIINKVSRDTGLNPFKLMPKTYPGNLIEDCIFPSPYQWLRSFMDAKFIVTDSFHGTVFAILFNKPFVTIANEGRGKARFVSLLNVFKLKDKLICNRKEIHDGIYRDWDFENINDILQTWKMKSYRFLETNLV